MDITKENIEVVVRNVFYNCKALAEESKFMADVVVEDMLVGAERSAKSLQAEAKVEEPKAEEKKEEPKAEEKPAEAPKEEKPAEKPKQEAPKVEEISKQSFESLSNSNKFDKKKEESKSELKEESNVEGPKPAEEKSVEEKKPETPVEKKEEKALETEKKIIQEEKELEETNEKVLKAMVRVPRHRFVLPEYLNSAYGDHPLPIGEAQTISQPYMVALMTECLDLKGDEKVLGKPFLTFLTRG